jgi:cell fate regulator YaaT (PSP1 superfamily)
MPAVVGVRFKRLPKILYLDATGWEDLRVNDYVVVNTEKCRHAARVIIAPRQLAMSTATEPLPKIVRRITASDLARWQTFKEKEDEALRLCRERVHAHQLDMHLLQAEYNFDGTHLTFYFTAEGRVDFRALVKDLTALFPARVELWQIGPRDRARLMGGLGECGRVLCCAAIGGDYPKASVKMAKDQDLPLGPNAATGPCGRPLCCLAYEQPTYEQAKAWMPRVGEVVQTARGLGKVTGRSVPCGTMTVLLDGGVVIACTAAEVERVDKNYAAAQVEEPEEDIAA